VVKKRLRQKFGGDAYYSFLHAPLEVAAWGGEVIYVDDGPPNSGEPFIKSRADIRQLKVPDVKTNKQLAIALECINHLAEIATEQVPIIGVIMSPFSLPVMQMGFDKYLDLIYEDRALFWQLMEANISFCLAWAEAQIAAGATALVYFDPVSSPTIIPRDLYLETGFKIAQRVISQVKAGVVTHLASGISLPIMDEIIQTGTVGIGVSVSEDIGEIKQKCKNKITVLGNLNGIEMRTWDVPTAEAKVREVIEQAAPGGGFILLDNHGEIPWDVPDEIIYTITEAAAKWGTYPIGKRE
jgi:uroporphyrinogen decarboxylase